MRKEGNAMMDFDKMTEQAQRLHSMIKLIATAITSISEKCVLDPADLAPAMNQLEDQARDLREAMEVTLAEYNRVEGG